jgi:hypothetical protein
MAELNTSSSDKLSRRATNLFIGLFLAALLFTFFSQKQNWPFIPYDMYASNYPTLELKGKTHTGRMLTIRGDLYFRYFEGFHFRHAMLGFYNDHPEQFQRIMHELRLRYNEHEAEAIDSISVSYVQYGVGRDLPGAFF